MSRPIPFKTLKMPVDTVRSIARQLKAVRSQTRDYCGNREAHEYALYLAIENIDHTRTKTKSPQTNERFHQTIQNEFYASAFRRKLYHSLEQLQEDVDAWVQE